MKQASQKYNILYGRLSQEDDREGDSNSIQNQQLMLEKYAADNGFENTLFLSDDGYSGTNFNRPSWNEVMRMVENDEVATIIVKDMSRLGREYLQVGRLMEIVFPNYDVRFIAIQDNVDSLYGDNDFTPFKNLFNDFYAKDTSRKIRAVKKAQAERGERVGTRAPYGYKKDPDNSKKIIPDEEATAVVEKIFNLCTSGSGPSQIAKRLKQEQIFTPGSHYYNSTGILLTNVDLTRPYDWNSQTVIDILENEVYLGHTISLKSTTLSYKNKKRIQRPESEQLRFENTHKPLVKQETWDIVRDIRKRRRRPAKMAEQNMFSGLVYCVDCKETMTLNRAHTMDAVKNNFVCSTYRKRGKDQCSSHYIRETQLATVVLDDLLRVTHFARQQEDLFIRHISQKNSIEIKREIKHLLRELEIMRHRDAELTLLFKHLYEDKVLSRITSEQFRILSDEYNNEQTGLKEKIPQTTERIEKLKSSISDVSRFIDKAKQYTKIPELTAELLLSFIQRIEVSEREEKYSRTAEQTITIHYRDIGVLDAFEAEEVTGTERAVV